MISLVEIGPVVLEKIFLNFGNVLLLFRNYLPLEKGRELHLKKLESPLPNDDWPSLDKIGSVFLDKRIF